jgi:hypothetical protein
MLESGLVAVSHGRLSVSSQVEVSTFADSDQLKWGNHVKRLYDAVNQEPVDGVQVVNLVDI